MGWLLWQRDGRTEAQNCGQSRIAANNAGAAAGRRATSYKRQVRLPLDVRGQGALKRRCLIRLACASG